MKRTAGIVLAAVLFLLAGLCVFACIYPAETWKYYFSNPKIEKRNQGELRIHFIDVGQGDCTLLELPDGRSMIIDGGNGSQKTELAVMRYLNALGIDKPDFVLLTHPDSDHAGSLDALLKHKGAKVVYLPKIEDRSINAEYAEFCARVEKSGAEKRVSHAGEVISSQSAEYPYTLLFLSPKTSDNPDCEYNAVNDGEYDETDVNDCSAVVWLDYFGVSALFTGDAGKSVEEKLLAQAALGVLKYPNAPAFELSSTEILKVAHHGSADSTGLAFFGYLNVKTAVISCGKGNAYGHPHADTLKNLERYGASVCRTDVSGSVMITVSPDGKYNVTTQKE
ncbi:MAG: MBL fold metallo-hydrolase [Clostridia bacterium]|nr:MBL fold metallo-hydrolase [Clostridia bacterium]